MMENLPIINILYNRAADIHTKLKSITSNLHNMSASTTFIKKALIFNMIPKFTIVKEKCIFCKKKDVP